MSASAILLAPTLPPESSFTMTSICTHCGHDLPTADEADRRIKDLEAQVRLLNTKAAAAVDKLADYEDEVRSLRSAYAQLLQGQQSPRTTSKQSQPLQPVQPQSSVPSPPPDQAATSPTVLTPPTTSTPPNASSPPRTISRLASLSSFLPGRKRETGYFQQQPSIALFTSNSTSTTTLQDTISPTDVTQKPQANQSTLLSLQTSLETERSLRLRAESDLTQTQSELEELTATLFGQANEMVATERKARAKLEERVKVLEERVKVLEDRDGEKRRRLERLEKALERIERVRGLVAREAAERKGDFEGEKVKMEFTDGDGAVEKVDGEGVNETVLINEKVGERDIERESEGNLES